MATIKENSKLNIKAKDGDELRVEWISAGCLQRIADACELMAKNHAQLVADHDLYKRWYYEQRERVAKRDRTIAALRGQITKLKKKGGAA